MLTKPCPISDARRIGEKIGANRVLIIALDSDGAWTGTTWGKNRAKCKALGEWLDTHGEKVAVHVSDRT